MKELTNIQPDNVVVITDEKQKPWLFQKGESGNPQGRPKGSFSVKTRLIERLENNPEALERMIQVLISDYPGLVFQMIDGRPIQSREQESRELPIPIMSLVRFVSRDEANQSN